MNLLLANEGGYQQFHLGGAEWFWLIFSGITALIAIAVGFGLMNNVLAFDQGTPKMQEIAKAIQEGALAYLRRQFRTIAIILVPLAVLVFVTSTKVVKPDGVIALEFWKSGLFRTIAFVGGCLMSGLTGFIGMGLAVRGNVRTAAAAKTGSLKEALKVAFRTGAVCGMFTVGLGLFGATLIIMIFQNTASAILIGFGFGGSLLALFLRVGGGIFTKAADVGADLVGKVEAGIPEDDPRNPATIADNVGDNVGDCAGMAADLFESYEVTLVASIILGVAAFHSIYPNNPDKWVLGLIFPVIARALGVIASIIGVFAVRATDKDRTAMAPINRGFLTAGLLTVIGTLAVALGYVGNGPFNEGWKLFGAVAIGLVLAQVVSRLTEYYTSTERPPVREIAEAARTGPATTVLSGISSGLESTVFAIIAIAIAIAVAISLGGGNIQFTFYLVALTGMGMLATTGIVVSEDTFGPVSDNAAGIAEMSGEFEGEPERIMVSLDAVGNTTKAVTKGFAIGSAVIAALALFASFIETIGSQFNIKDTGSALFHHPLTQINVADPKTFIGLLIGGSIAFLFSALAIRAVGRTAGVVVQEVRRQFADGGIMAGTKKPDYGPVIDICTAASLRELATPALLAVLSPVVIGFGINYLALGAFLAAVILTGQLMANFLSNSGGAWDNAKKYIEDGHEGGKGSEAHKAAVIGDTVGDPFKDTAGPALNPLIKVMNLVSLLILPSVISLRNNDGARYAIAGAALVVIGIAVAFSKRKTTAMDEGVGTAAAAVEAAEVMNGDRDATLKAAIDRWIYDLGHEEHELRDRLLEVKRKLETASS
ncbi:MAG: V-type H(+)-translocating pyrophosphatase [Acidimicrobiales bacterium]|jgi:K(+)-stimulated pyrophosphate-energized sodium pump|nr:V-type H(+)-translocating pyrophosphatase [Acidimicrobiales bacterium]